MSTKHRWPDDFAFPHKGPIYLAKAREFVVSAEILRDNDLSWHLNNAITTLAFTAAELALKGTLLASGMTYGKLKNLSHNLNKTMRCAISVGLEIEAEHAETLILSNEPYRDSVTRYDPIVTTAIPPAEGVMGAAKHMIDRAELFIAEGAEIRGGDATVKKLSTADFDRLVTRTESEYRTYIEHVSQDNELGLQTVAPVQPRLGTLTMYRPNIRQKEE